MNAFCPADGEGTATLTSYCMKLPDKEEEACLSEPIETPDQDECGEDEFNCGNGQCVHGLQLCDHKYDCWTGADELKW